MTEGTERPEAPRDESRRARLSLRVALVLIAIIAVSLAGYRWGYRRWRGYHTVAVRVYSVADLVTEDRTEGYRPLIDEIAATVQPDTWTARGGGSMTPFFLNRSLIVRNNLVAHEEIAAALRRKRAGSADPP